MAVIAELLKTRGLPPVHRRIILGVVAHQDLYEGRMKLLNMCGVLGAELELKLSLTALFCRERGDETIGKSIAQDARAKLLIDQDAGPVLCETRPESELKPIVDDVFGLRDALCLF